MINIHRRRRLPSRGIADSNPRAKGQDDHVCNIGLFEYTEGCRTCHDVQAESGARPTRPSRATIEQSSDKDLEYSSSSDQRNERNAHYYYYKINNDMK
mmetsp:Transcript_28058/g.77161  ORF Transcript_28058/g.77161 Transcript_28058/m.77161 type:complete len:98 (+) Transcript_28058:239-532(+)